MRRVAWERGQGEGITWGSVIVGGHLGNLVSGCQLGEMSEFENFIFWLCHRACRILVPYPGIQGFPGSSVVKKLPARAGDARDAVLNPGLGRSPGGGHGNPLQYSCLENPMDKGAWQTIVHRVAKESDMTEQLSMHTQEYRNSRIGGISSFSLATVSS